MAHSDVLKRQGRVGVFLAGCIILAWCALHVYAVFLHEIENLALSVFLFCALTWLSVGLFIVAHDSMHRSLAPLHPRLNAWIGKVCIFLYAGFIYKSLLSMHGAHHAAPGTADDPDFHAGAPDKFWRWYYRFFTMYFGWPQLLHISLRLILYWAFGAPIENILLFFAAPSILSSMQLFLFGTWLPHRHHDDDFEDAHNARSNNYPVWLSLLTCFHFGYHHEHHLKPGTPWWGLPKERLTRRHGPLQK